MNRRNNILCVALVLCAQAMNVQAGVAEVQGKIEALRARACTNIFRTYFEAWREIDRLTQDEHSARAGCIEALTKAFKEKLRLSNEDETVVRLWMGEENPELLAQWVRSAKKSDMPANYYTREVAPLVEPAAFASAESDLRAEDRAASASSPVAAPVDSNPASAPSVPSENPAVVSAPAPVPASPAILPIPAAAPVVPKLAWYHNSYLKYGAYFVAISGATYTMYRYYESRKQVSFEEDAEASE